MDNKEQNIGLDKVIVGLSKQLPDSKLNEALRICSFGLPECTEPIYFRTMTISYKDQQLLGVFAFCSAHDPQSNILVEDMIKGDTVGSK